MTFDGLPYGVNVTAYCYDRAKDWYIKSEATQGFTGVLERAGKACAVVPAHLITGALIAPMNMIYDLVLGTFFLLANLCTAFTFDELRERLMGHCSSVLDAPFEIFKNLKAALCPPIAYRGEEAVNFQYGFDYQAAFMPTHLALAHQFIRVVARRDPDFTSQDELGARIDALQLLSRPYAQTFPEPT